MKATFKAVLSVVLSYLMVISVLPLSVIAISAVEVTLQGDGTEQSPYHIYTAEDYVYAMGSYAFDDEVYLSLDNDIEVGSINCSEFRAHLNGNFHKIDAGSILCGTNYGSIKNLNYNNYQLCSGNSSTGEIANTIVTAEISGYAMSQGLFCSGNSGKILNCAVFGKLLLDNEAGCRAAGISVTNSGTISNCYVVADIKAVGHSCYGTSHDHPICLGNYENSYYNSDISKGYNSDGLSTEFMQSQAFVDLLNKNIKTKDYLWTLDTDSQNQGYPVIKTAYNATITSSKTNLLINGTEQIELYSDDSVSVYYTLDGSEPDSSSILYNAPIEISDSVIIKAIGYKDGLTGRAVDFHYVKMRGNGTKEFPYLIDSETAFRAMSELPMNAYYEVTNNIELTESISSLDNFYGFIEGNNHTISGVFSDNRQNGIFKKNYGVIQNLNLNSDNQIFKSNGAFVYINHGVINHCSFNGTVIGYTYEGGDFDKVSYKAQKCTGLGGFVSMNYGTICDSVFTGELRADEGNTVGGFVGVNSGTINNCLFDGNVFVDDTYFDSLSYGGNYFYNFVTGFVGINSTNGSIALSTADTLVIYAISRSFSPTSVYTFCGNMDSNIDDCRCSNAKATIGGSYLEYGENLVVSQVLTGTGYTDPSHVHHCNMTMMEPTCTESGSATFICSECGTEIQSKTFAALGHNYVYVDVPSTYDEQGYYGNICSRCGDVNYITYREKLQIISGSCGENCTYYMDVGNGTMIISGSGAMTDYNASSDVPWHSFKEYIKEIQVSDEITSIGKNTFSYCDNLIEISLPNIINIGDYAFYYSLNLKTISINKAETIGKFAFANCKNLKNISFPSVQNIGESAFQQIQYNGIVLTSVTLPQSLTTVGKNAFLNETKLKTINFLGSTDDWARINFENYSANPKYYAETLLMNGEEITEVNLSTGITEIKPYTFYRISTLKKVTLPDTVTNIGSNAFYYCRTLEKVFLPDSLQVLSENAFGSCNAIKELTLPCSVKVPASSYSNAFSDCKNIIKITLLKGTGTMTEFTAASKPWNSSKSSLTEVVFEDGISNIIDNAFNGYSNLEFVTLPTNSVTIGKDAFKDTKWIKNQYDNGLYIKDHALIGGEYAEGDVMIPDTVTEICDSAFAGNKTMTSLTIPESVKIVGDNAFANCSNLKELTIPCSLDIYKAGMFSGCTNLQKLTMTKGSGTMLDFSNKYSYTPWYLSAEKFTTLIIDDGVTNVSAYAFGYLSNLSDVSLPESVSSIGNFAFCQCKELKSIDLPKNLKSIGLSAFTNCTSLEKFIVPDSVETFGNTVLYNCTSLNELSVPCSLNITANSNNFKNCTNIAKITLTKGTGVMRNYYIDTATYTPWYISRANLEEIILEEGITNIGDYAFYSCKGITEIELPDTIVSIGERAFDACNTLTNINIPSSVKEIKKWAFRGCTGLNKLTIPETVETLGVVPFINCSGIKTLTLPSNFATTAFSGCANIETITITKGNGVIEGTYSSYQYSPCYVSRNTIKNVYLEEGIINLGNYAFYGCTGLTEIAIPHSVTSIGTNAFYGCTGLSSIVLPISVSSVESYAFRSCNNLEKIYFLNDSCSISPTYTIPATTTIIGYSNSTAQEYANQFSRDFVEIIKLCPDCGSPITNSVTVDSTCTEKGHTTLTCDNCGHTETTEISEKGHTLVTDNGKPATCTDTGLTEGLHCSVCGEVFTAQEIIPSNGHTPVIDAAKAPTCTETGLTEGSHCSICGEVIKVQEVVPAAGHTPVIDEAKAPICKGTGLTEGSHCSVCGEVIKAQEIIPATGHTEVIDEAKAPTCTETGLTEGSHCSVCGEVIKAQEIIPATGHTPVIDKGTAPACTETGLTDGSHCSVCGEIIKAQDIIPAKGHTPVTDKGYPATLRSTGLTDGSHCSVCGKVLEQQKEIPVLEYVMVVVGSTSEIFGTKWDYFNYDNIMTENSDGSYTMEYNVNKAYKEVQIMVAKSSNNDIIRYGDENGNIVSFSLTGTCTFTVTATPSANGYIVSVAGGNVKIITDLEYSAVYAVGNGEGAWLNGVTWNSCDKNNSMTEISDDVWEIEYKNVSAGSHQLKFAIDGDWMHNFGGVFNNSSVVTDAVYNGDNILFETKGLCTVKVQLDLRNFNFRTKQGAKFTITIICYHDSIKTEKGYSADCTHDGLTDSEICEICGTVLVEHKVIPAKGHTEVIDKGKAPTCTETGLTDGSHCSVCGEIIKAQEVIPATGHTKVIDKGKAPTCTETGLTDGSHCSVCGEIIKAQEVIPATGHTWDNGTVTKAADCHHEGEMTYRCSECHEKRTEVIPMLEHQWDDGTITKEPTYTEPGEVKYTCSLCGDTRTEPVPCKEKKGKLTISNETVRAGDEVTVKLYLDENPGITALSININFPNEFILKDVQYMGLFPNQPSSSPMNYNPFTISWASPTSTDIDNTGLFAVLTFDVGIDVPLADYPITVTYNAENVFDSAFVNVPLDIENGTVSVLKPTPGDVNRDGNINMKDLVLIQQLINRWDVQIVESAADVTDDGEINMKDLVLLQRYINGWEVVLR